MSSSNSKSSSSKVLQKIKSRFEKLYNLHGEPILHNPNTATKKDVEFSLRKYGVFISKINNLEETYTANLKGLNRIMYNIIFDERNSHNSEESYPSELERLSKKYPHFSSSEREFAALSGYWNSASGFGNSSFRFVYMQFLKTPIVFPVNNTNVEFTYNPVHSHNLRVFSKHPELWDILKRMYLSSNPMISWDSQKARFFDTGVVNKVGSSKITKATKPGMTPRHNDVYEYGGKELDRIQAMLILSSPRRVSSPVSLGFVLFSNDMKIRRLIEKYLGKTSSGFSTVNDVNLNPILDRFWRSIPNGFIMWNQATIHYEGVSVETPSRKQFSVDRLLSTVQSPQSLREITFRLVIGTHTPVELSEDSRRELMFLSEKGFLPEIYVNNRPNNRKITYIHKNLVNSKTTQWAIPRDMLKVEENIIKSLDDQESTLDENIPDILKEMYGIYDFHKEYPLSVKYNTSVSTTKDCILSTSVKNNVSYDDVLRVIL